MEQGGSNKPHLDALRKKISALEARFKKLESVNVDDTNVRSSNEFSTMFTKKHVGPMNCASCENAIPNLLAERVEFVPW